ncbi:MAG: peptidylprolyl isomerase [Saprospiraceae bacterium]|nr:peptidylprolyl isomerase [Saprospiraceae bacterium]
MKTFDNLAQRFSEDQNSAGRGGNLGFLASRTIRNDV